MTSPAPESGAPAAAARVGPAQGDAPSPDAARLLRQMADLLGGAEPRAAEEAFGRFLTSALERRGQVLDRGQEAQAVAGLDTLRARVADDLWTRVRGRLDERDRDLRSMVEQIVDRRLELILQRLLHSREWGTQVLAVARGEAQAVRKDLERVLLERHPVPGTGDLDRAIDDLLRSDALADRIRAVASRAPREEAPAAAERPVPPDPAASDPSAQYAATVRIVGEALDGVDWSGRVRDVLAGLADDLAAAIGGVVAPARPAAAVSPDAGEGADEFERGLRERLVQAIRGALRPPEPPA